MTAWYLEPINVKRLKYCHAFSTWIHRLHLPEFLWLNQDGRLPAKVDLTWPHSKRMDPPCNRNFEKHWLIHVWLAAKPLWFLLVFVFLKLPSPSYTVCRSIDPCLYFDYVSDMIWFSTFASIHLLKDMICQCIQSSVPDSRVFVSVSFLFFFLLQIKKIMHNWTDWLSCLKTFHFFELTCSCIAFAVGVSAVTSSKNISGWVLLAAMTWCPCPPWQMIKYA